MVASKSSAISIVVAKYLAADLN